MDAKQLTPILIAVLLAYLAFPAKSEGGGDVETSAGGLRRQLDEDPEEMVGSSKFHVVLCVRNRWCPPGNRTCYCCETMPNARRCFWSQQECWDSCPNHRQQKAGAPGPAPAPAAALPSSFMEEPSRSII